MPYLKVLVAEASYHGKEGLTYSADLELPKGKIVVVPLKNQLVNGIVVSTTSKPSFTVKQITAVPDLNPLPAPLLELLEWMRHFYPAPLGAITQHFLPRNLPQKTGQTSPSKSEITSLPPLTADQRQALSRIRGSGLHLLHGETGTGKTRIYLELATSKLREGKSAIILTPEISLTSQLANEFQKILGLDKIKVFHSQLTQTTRQKIWKEILQADEPFVVIGPRSALFSPLKNVGLIVVDESHEAAYKQDKAPYHHASTVSAQLALLHKAVLVLGSATPLVSDYYVAKAKARPIIYMNQTATASTEAPPRLSVVDRRARQEFTRSQHLSNTLLVGMAETLERKEQVLLFLNRRGTARLVLCENCGWQAVCPHCDLPLTYHGDTHRLQCHTCSYKSSNPSSCPECHNPTILFKTVGTKAIVDEVEKLFPEARVQRFDTDNKKAERLESHYASVRAGEIDILVGTQTLAKGLDLPKLGFVGVINAETSLSFPDFSATERTYQLLVQVLGRIGRGHRATQAVIQSYSPDSSLIQAAVTKNWNDFYNKELAERKKCSFPPFCYLLRLTCRRASRASAEKAATNLKKSLEKQYPSTVVEGPAASFHEKIQDQYKWQLVVKSKSRTTLLTIIRELPANWSYDIDPIDLL